MKEGIRSFERLVLHNSALPTCHDEGQGSADLHTGDAMRLLILSVLVISTRIDIAYAQDEVAVFDTSSVPVCPDVPTAPESWQVIAVANAPVRFHVPAGFTQAKPLTSEGTETRRWRGEHDTWILWQQGDATDLHKELYEISRTERGPEGNLITYGCNDCFQITSTCRSRVGEAWAWIVEGQSDGGWTHDYGYGVGIAVPVAEEWTILWIRSEAKGTIELGRQIVRTAMLTP